MQTRFARTIFFFEVMNTIFRYDLLLISLSDKIIRYIPIDSPKQKMKCFYSILII